MEYLKKESIIVNIIDYMRLITDWKA